MTRFLFIMIFFSNAALAQHQQVDTLNISSKIFNATRKIKVALPEEYFDKPDNNYVVVYLFDSQSEDFFNFYRTTISYLSKQGYIKPAILVGIASENRQYEFTPAAQTTAGVKYFQKSGGAAMLAEHLQKEVVPAIAAKYRTINYNIGLGHSLGATFVTYCLLNNPQLFNAVIAVSPNYQYDNLQMVNKFDSLIIKAKPDHKSFTWRMAAAIIMKIILKPVQQKLIVC
jgi:predicted alpha/beta superfamily hydrolase